MTYGQKSSFIIHYSFFILHSSSFIFHYIHLHPQQMLLFLLGFEIHMILLRHRHMVFLRLAFVQVNVVFVRDRAADILPFDSLFVGILVSAVIMAIGFAFGAGSIFFEVERWSFLQQGAAHLALTSAVWIIVELHCIDEFIHDTHNRFLHL